MWYDDADIQIIGIDRPENEEWNKLSIEEQQKWYEIMRKINIFNSNMRYKNIVRRMQKILKGEIMNYLGDDKE